MKIAGILLILIVCQISPVESGELKDLRKLYYKATVDRSSADQFIRVMEELNVHSEPLLLCYRGMAHLIMAKYSFNPYSKLSYFKTGKDLMEESVQMAPDNIEIRFMRFCVQMNAPFFLGYSGDIDKDKSYIISGWRTIQDLDLKQKVKEYMIECDCCTASEKALFLM